ncbi:MAG: hypothetical protein ACRBCK_12350 [Alphaproteobacteria bacterium]
MENTVTSINDTEIEAIITELEKKWIAEKSQFVESAWLKLCDELSQEASKGCGLSFDYFVEKFSVSIDYRLSKLPENHQQRAMEIAKQYGYATPEEIEENKEFLDDMGYCSHGIELGCCPAGCGS